MADEQKADETAQETAQAKPTARRRAVKPADQAAAPVAAEAAEAVADAKPVARRRPARAAAAKAEASAEAVTAKAVTVKTAAEPVEVVAQAVEVEVEVEAPAKPARAPKAAATAEPKAVATAAPAKPAPAESGSGGLLRVHHLRPAPGARTAKARVGRGEGSKGKSAGRGTKGTKARYQVPARFEGGQMPMHMRLPKLRGFRNPFRVEYQVVNLDKISALYPDGGDVTVADLVIKGAVRKGQPVKVLGTGELTVKVAVAVDAFSASAKEKIEAAGGSVVVPD